MFLHGSSSTPWCIYCELCAVRFRSFVFTGNSAERLIYGMKFNMSRKKVITIICAAIIGVIIFQAGKTVGAATAKPGSSGDPLITKSYLEQQLKNAGSSGYEKVTVPKGSTITFSDGAEVVIYKGSAVITGTSGMINLSTGEIFSKDMTPVMYNTFLSIDKSGFKASGNMTIYVNGNYSIK